MITVDLHLHTNFSDGKIPLDRLIDLCGEAGLDAIAVTDHLCTSKHILGISARLLKYTLTEKNWQEYVDILEKERNRAWRQYKMIVFTGVEYSHNTFDHNRNAHMLAVDLKEFISPELNEEEWLRCAKAAGALTVAAHPLKLPDATSQTYYLLSNWKKFHGLIDTWEVANARTLWKEMLAMPFSLIASSDLHTPKKWDSWRTQLPCDKDPEAIKAHLRDSFSPREFVFMEGHAKHAVPMSRKGGFSDTRHTHTPLDSHWTPVNG